MLVFQGDYEYALYIGYDETWTLHVYHKGCWLQTYNYVNLADPFGNVPSTVVYNGWR